MQAFWCHPLSSRLQLSIPQWGIWHSHFLMGKEGSPIVRYSGEHWASVHLGRQAFWQVQSSGMPLIRGPWIPALAQERLDSPARALANAQSLSSLGIQALWCCPLSSRLKLSSPQWRIWYSHSLMEKQGSPVVRHSGKCWAFLRLREPGLLATTVWQITTQWWSSVPAL
jgi:hypothetical protein